MSMININTHESNWDQSADLISKFNEKLGKPGYFRFEHAGSVLKIVNPEGELLFKTSGPDNCGMMVVFLNGINIGMFFEECRIIK